MVLLLIVAPLLIGESRDPAPGRFDLLGAFLALVSTLAMVYGIKKIAEDGGGFTVVVIGALVAGLFVARQLKAESPMIDVHLFVRPAFTGSIMANGIVVFAAAG